MFREEYGEAAVEVLDILDNMNKESVEKIPKNFIKFLVEIANMYYKVSLDYSKTIDEMDLDVKTKEILGYIYINWWSNDKEKQEFEKKIEEIEQKHQIEASKKYNPDNIFKNSDDTKIDEVSEKEKTTNETLSVVEYKENIFKRVINKIISFFI